MTIAAKNIIFRANDEAAAATITLAQVLEVLNARLYDYYAASFPTLVEIGAHTVLAIDNVGQKYIRIIAGRPDGGQRSVHCFLDYQGNIYRADGWKKPAKHIRGSVFDDNCSWGRGLGPYGAAYLK